MPFMGTLKRGAPLKISISCAAKNQGITLVDVGANPVPGEDPPEEKEFQVAPGASRDDLAPKKVPTKIKRLYIDVTLPDAGKATLEVESGEDTWSDKLDDDVSWLFLVVP